MPDLTETRENEQRNTQKDQRSTSKQGTLSQSKDVEKGKSSTAKIATTRKPNAPIDRGWAWVVLAAAMLQMFIAIGFIKCLGIYYVQFQRHFDISVSAVSLAITVQNLTCSITSLITMTIGLHLMSCRTSIIIGSAILGLSHILCSVAESIELFYFSFGFLYGIGFAFILSPALACLGMYFDKRRGLANNVAQIGAGVGGLVFNPLLTKLFHIYGFSGTMLLIAGMYFNIIVAGALMRPLEIYKEVKLPAPPKPIVKKAPSTKQPEVKSKPIALKNRRRRMERIGSGTFLKGASPMSLQKVTGEEEETAKFVPEVSPLALNDGMTKKHMFWTFSKSTPSSSEETVCEDTAAKTRFIRMQGLPRAASHDPNDIGEVKPQNVPRYRTSSMSNKRPTSSSVAMETPQHASLQVIKQPVSSCASYEFMNASMLDLALSTPDMNSTETEFTCAPCDSTLIRRICSAMFDVTLLKNPMFIIYLLSTGLLCAGCSAVGVFIAPHAEDVNIDDDRIGYLMGTISGVDLVARVIFGVLSDSGLLRRSTLIAICSAALAIPCFLMSFITSYTSLIIFAVVLGLLNGVYFSLYAVVIVDYLSVAKLKPSLGFSTLVQGIATAITFPVLGALRDQTGNYEMTYYVIGVLLILGSGLIMLLPVVERKVKEREQTTTTTTTTTT